MRTRLAAIALVSACLLMFVAARAAVVAPLADAAERGDKAAIADLLRKQVDVNAAQADGMTALHWSALNGDVNTVAALLAAKANVDPVTRLGDYTPLHLAAERGHA